MLIKGADDQTPLLEELERRAAGVGADAKHAARELRIRRAGIKGERDSAYLIDFHFAQAPNWAVIHDLRIEHGNRVAQIDHLLINRWLDFYVLESKHFHAGIKITEEGEFLQWNAYKKSYEGMASPLEQNERHIQVLQDAVSRIELPVRLGVRIPPNFTSLVLVSSKARIDRPSKFDTTRVIKADHLKKRIWKDIDDESPLLGLLRTAAKIVSRETLEHVARQLATLHRPLSRSVDVPPTLSVSSPPVRRQSSRNAIRAAPAPKSAEPRERTIGSPSCKSCSGTGGSVLYGKYGYYFKCSGCETNTAIRFVCQPGHRPRVRKAGNEFYRDCKDCGSSDLFHRNQSAAT